MARTDNLTNFLTDVASAIKNKKGTQTDIPAENFDTEIASISTGIDTSDATAVAGDIASLKTAYVDGQKITGSLAVVQSGNTTIAGPDNITCTETEDYFTSRRYVPVDVIHREGAGMEIDVAKSQVASTIGLTAGKILSGNTILDIAGTATSDADATASDILSGKTAYVNGQKITGTGSGAEDLNAVITAQENKLAALENIINRKTGGSGDGSSMNVFVQTTEPTKKKGVWLQTNKNPEYYTFDNDVHIGGNWLPDNSKSNIPFSFELGGSCIIGNDIYLFMGTNACKYNVLTDTFTTLTNIPYNFNGRGVVAIGTDIYICRWRLWTYKRV